MITNILAKIFLNGEAVLIYSIIIGIIVCYVFAKIAKATDHDIEIFTFPRESHFEHKTGVSDICTLVSFITGIVTICLVTAFIGLFALPVIEQKAKADDQALTTAVRNNENTKNLQYAFNSLKEADSMFSDNSNILEQNGIDSKAIMDAATSPITKTQEMVNATVPTDSWFGMNIFGKKDGTYKNEKSNNQSKQSTKTDDYVKYVLSN